MAEAGIIKVRRTNDGELFEFAVTIRDASSETRHRVLMTRKTWERLDAGRRAPERCIEAAFRFLLDREPKESILGRFDIMEISRYFPEFEQELPHYLEKP